MKFWVNKDNKDYGPYTRAEIVAFRSNGVFSDEDSACKVGDTNWSTVGALFPRPAPPSPPPSSKPEPTPPPEPVRQTSERKSKNTTNCSACGALIAKNSTGNCTKCGRYYNTIPEDSFLMYCWKDPLDGCFLVCLIPAGIFFLFAIANAIYEALTR